MLADTAILSVWDALAEMIRAGGAPPVGPKGEPLLASRRVYIGRTTKGAQTIPLGYFLVWAPVTEDEGGFYGEPGQEGGYRVGCWHDTPDGAVKMFRWFKRLVHGEGALMEDHTLWQPFTVRFLGLQAGPKDEAFQALCEVLSLSEQL